MKLSYISKESTLLLWLLYVFNAREVFALKWKENLQKALNEKTKMHQQLLLYENDFNNSIIYQIESKIAKMMPTRVVNFKNMIARDKQNLRLDPHVLRVSRVVIIPSENTQNVSELFKILDSVAKMSQQKKRPKVLIAITNATKIPKYKKFFQLCWSKQFLDISILKLEHLKESELTPFADSFNGIDADLRYYNPFTMRSTKTQLKQHTVLFPNKLRNMNGYMIKTGVFHFPPYVNISRNSTGHILKVHGPDINLWTTMSEVINFSLKMKLYNLTNWPLPNCTKEYTTGLVRKLIYNELQFMGIQSLFIKSCVSNFHEIGKGTRSSRMVILVPNFPATCSELIEWNLSKVALVFGLILSPWLMSRCLSFESQKWKWTYSVQMSLGFATPQMPRKILERIVFILMTFFFLFQSSFIHSTLLNFQLLKKVVHEVKTLDELIAKNLTLYTDSLAIKFDNDDTAFKKFINKAIYSEMLFVECAQMANDYQNVSCYGREHSAYLVMQRIKNSGRQINIKVFMIDRMVPGSFIFFAEGSPYPDRFSFVSSVLIESGISEKWDAAYLPKMSLKANQSDSSEQDISLTSKVLKLMMILLSLG